MTCAIFVSNVICGMFFFLWLFKSSVPKWIIANLVNLCFNVQEPAALGSEHFNWPLIGRDKECQIYGKYLQPC